MSSPRGLPRSKSGTSAFLLPLAAATALALACLPVSGLFSDTRWVGPTLLTIALVCAVGGALRALPVPMVAIPVVQSAVFVVTMAYLLPTVTGGVGERLAAFRDLVSGSIAAVEASKVPAAGAPEIVALLVVAVFIAALLVDTLTVGLGLAGGSGVVLLVMAAVPVGLTSQGVPLLMGPAVGWLLLMAADQWARLRAQDPSPGKRVEGLESTVGLFAIMTASLVCSGLLIALVAPAPGPRPWLLSLGERAEDSPAAVTVDPFVDIREQLQAGNRQQQILSYRSSDGRAVYLGMVTLELFDGESWAPYPRVAGADSSVVLPRSSDAAPGPTFDIRVANLGNPYLPVPDYASAVFIAGTSGPWTWDPRTSDIASSDTPARGLAYRVVSVDGAPDPGALSEAGSQGPGVSDAARRLPGELQAAVEPTALEVTAGSATNFDRALKLQEWFARTGGFAYSLTVPDPGERDPVVAFLADRQGFCQQYATAMAVLARSLQIPARVVVGFAGGSQQDGGGFLVTGGDAHAWPELWFDDIGWVRFEPTPASVNPSLTPPAYALTATDNPTTPSPVPSASAPSSAEPSAQPDLEAGGSGRGGMAAVVAGSGLVLALIALAAPRTVRRRSRTRRLADLAAGDAVAAWTEIQNAAVDAGIGWSAQATTRQQAAGLVEAIDPSPPGEDPAAWPALQSVVAAVEERLYAPALNRVAVPEYRPASATILDEPWMLPGPGDLATDVRDVLRRIDDIPRPLSGRVFPRSLRWRGVPR